MHRMSEAARELYIERREADRERTGERHHARINKAQGRVAFGGAR